MRSAYASKFFNVFKQKCARESARAMPSLFMRKSVGARARANASTTRQTVDDTIAFAKTKAQRQPYIQKKK